MHVHLIDILIHQFLMDGLVNTICFEVGHLYVYFGTLNACVRDDCWHIWIGEGRRCLGHDGWLTDITVG